MTRKIKIIDEETGETLREAYIPNVPTFLGNLKLTPRDLAIIGSVIISVVTFFVVNHHDKEIMKATLSELKITSRHLTEFRDNSDAWNREVYGTRFKDGQPIDLNFKFKNRGILNP